eukprot:8855-Pelagococcus_subviridis.AAC.1
MPATGETFRRKSIDAFAAPFASDTSIANAYEYSVSPSLPRAWGANTSLDVVVLSIARKPAASRST